MVGLTHAQGAQNFLSCGWLGQTQPDQSALFEAETNARKVHHTMLLMEEQRRVQGVLEENSRIETIYDSKD